MFSGSVIGPRFIIIYSSDDTILVLCAFPELIVSSLCTHLSVSEAGLLEKPGRALSVAYQVQGRRNWGPPPHILAVLDAIPFPSKGLLFLGFHPRDF